MTVEEIYNKMLAVFQTETGLTPAGDGDMAVRLYAVAAQIYSLYIQSDWVRRQCFPQTAQGDYLDYHAQMRGLERRAAVKAQGVLKFECDAAAVSDLTIPAGTVCMTAAQLRFETLEDAVLAADGTSVEVRAAALEPGSAGNVSAGSIRAMAVAPVGVSRCSNAEAFTGGVDAESDEALRERVLETFRRMPNGANTAFYQQGAMSFAEVAAAEVLPRARGVGTVDIVITTAAGVPDSALLETVEDYFAQRREIAVDVQVRAPEVVPVNVSAVVTVAEGADQTSVLEAVECAIQNWFDGKLLGKDVLRVKLGDLIFGVEGVENYSITAPADDVTVETDELPRLGTLSITAAEVSQ